jgi:hypothetical protein
MSEGGQHRRHGRFSLDWRPICSHRPWPWWDVYFLVDAETASQDHQTRAANHRTPQPRLFRRDICLDAHGRGGTAGAKDTHETHGPAADGARRFRFAVGGFAESVHHLLA